MVAFDGSPEANKAFEVATEHARSLRSELKG